MAADYDSAFGTYNYADSCGIALEEIVVTPSVKRRVADTPGMNRAYTAGGLRGGTTIQIKGQIIGTSTTNVRDRIDTFIAAHAPGIGKKFYPHSDRYYNAEVVGFSGLKFDGQIRFLVPFSVEFFAADPYAYADSATATSSLASGGTVTNGGHAPTFPTITVAVSSIGTNGTVTIGNTTTGQSLVLTPDATGTFTIDCAAQTVSRSSAYRPATHSGDWLRLNAGANTITVTLGGSATISSMSFSHRNAWY